MLQFPNNTDVFLENLIHAKHKIYGYVLRPLSLFHLSLLEKFDSPLVIGGKLSAEDIQLAAAICSSKDPEEFRNNISRPKLWSFIYSAKKEAEKWEDYYKDYISLPEYYETDKKPRDCPFPLYSLFLAKTIKETGYDWEYVFYKMPVGLIIWLNNAFSYLESGETNMISDTERQLIEVARKAAS